MAQLLLDLQSCSAASHSDPLLPAWGGVRVPRGPHCSDSKALSSEETVAPSGCGREMPKASAPTQRSSALLGLCQSRTASHPGCAVISAPTEWGGKHRVLGGRGL